MTVAHAELMSVGPDEVVVTFTTPPGERVTTRVGAREVTTEGPFHDARVTGLEPDTTYDVEAKRTELIDEYTERFANPYIAAERGYVDDVIDPRETRKVLSRSLAMLRTKREVMPSRKHGNVPL